MRKKGTFIKNLIIPSLILTSNTQIVKWKWNLMSIYLERETEETVVAKNKQISGHGQESDPVHQV